MTTLIVFVAVLISCCSACFSPVDHGIGNWPSQKFYFDKDWRLCLAFKYQGSGGNDNKFDSYMECKQTCDLVDDGPCRGPYGSVYIEGLTNCDNAKCPAGYECRMALPPAPPTCCSTENSLESDLAWSRRCPNGRFAEGFGGDLSWGPLVSTSCQELTCKGICIQVSKYFAKCCDK